MPKLCPLLLFMLLLALSQRGSCQWACQVASCNCHALLSLPPLPPHSLLTVSGCNSICQLPLEDLISCLHHHYHYHHHFHYAFTTCDVFFLFLSYCFFFFFTCLRVQLLHVRRHFVSGLFSVSNAISLLVFIFPAVCCRICSCICV